jgi:hypothetical protein
MKSAIQIFLIGVGLTAVPAAVALLSSSGFYRPSASAGTGIEQVGLVLAAEPFSANASERSALARFDGSDQMKRIAQAIARAMEGREEAGLPGLPVQFDYPPSPVPFAFLPSLPYLQRDQKNVSIEVEYAAEPHGNQTPCAQVPDQQSQRPEVLESTEFAQKTITTQPGQLAAVQAPLAARSETGLPNQRVLIVLSPARHAWLSPEPF